MSLQINYNPCYIFHANVFDLDYFQIALCSLCRWRMSPPQLRGPLLINNQLNKGRGSEMSLSDSVRKLDISTCFKLEKEMTHYSCSQMVSIMLCTILCRQETKCSQMQTKPYAKYSILAWSWLESFLALCMCMNLANLLNLRTLMCFLSGSSR